MNTLIIRHLGVREYNQVLTDMQHFTQMRNESTTDELWIVEHPPVFTLGQAGKRENLLDPGSIPVIKTDRGGQVTYHGPGQLVFYFLFDLRRLNLGIRQFVELIQNTIVSLLADYGIIANTQEGAPGVYVDSKKIASLGLRIKKGCSYHGLSLNVDMDLTPFEKIHPCGFPGLEVTQLSTLGIKPDMPVIINDFVRHLTTPLNYDRIEQAEYSAPD